MKYKDFEKDYLEKFELTPCNIFDYIVDPNHVKRFGGTWKFGTFKEQVINSILTSMGIKIGTFAESIITKYIEELGYTNLPKRLTDHLVADQLFADDEDNIYLIEQKVRDDHDNAKVDGQVQNFENKCKFLSKKYPNKTIYATEWFLDDALRKDGDKKYFLNQNGIVLKNVKTSIYYGTEIFGPFFKEDEIWFWNEIKDYLDKVKHNEIRFIDYGASEEGYQILKKYKEKHKNTFQENCF